MVLLASVVTLIVGCGDRDTPSGGPASPDQLPGGGSSGGQGSCESASPPHGIEVGQSFPDLKLIGCDGSEVALDTSRCDHEITLFSVGAGWCPPCWEEAPELQAAAAALGDQGVGVVQILFQDESAQPPTTAFCQEWMAHFGLTIPVLIDPQSNVLNFFEEAETPLNVVVDRDGEVLWSQLGKPDDVQAVLTDLLP